MSVIVEYQRDIAGHDGNPRRFKGERYGVADEEAAARYHPFAKIVEHEDGTPIAEAEGGEQKLADWFVRRQEKWAAEGIDTIPQPLAGEKAGEYDARVKDELEALKAAAAANQNGENGETGETGGETVATGEQGGGESS